MRGTIGLLLGLILLLGFGYFCYLNVVPVSVRFWPGVPPRTAFIGEIAAYSAIAGALVALLLMLGESLGTRRRCRQLARRVRELERRLPQVQLGASDLASLGNGPATPVGRVSGSSLANPPVAAIAAADEEPV
jgi:uncharacterized integral membrane protein